MKLGRRHWAVALLAAAFLQLALAAVLYHPYPQRGSGLSAGVDVELGPSLADGGADRSLTTAATGEPRQPTPVEHPHFNARELTEPDLDETTALSKNEADSAIASSMHPAVAMPAPAITPPAQLKARLKPATETSTNPPPKRKRNQNTAQNSLPPRTGIAKSTEANQQKSTESTTLTAMNQGTHEGASTAASAAAAADTRPGNGTAAAVSADYYHELAAWLEKHKQYPRRAVLRRQQGVVRVSFKIDRQGNLLSREIVASSGYRLLDEAADALLLRASPMPGIPGQSTAKVLELIVPIKYALR